VTVAYDQKGNITNKSDVGAYAYDPVKPHAVTSAGANTYTYDANGNMLEGAGRTVTWTSFNQARSIVKGAFTSTFSFDAAHQRVKHVSHHETTIYVGGVFEQVTPAGASPVVEFKHYILAPTGRVAVFTDRSNLQRDVKYFHTDGLGSITAVTDEKGAIVKRFAFDAWGKRINPVTGMAITGADAAGLRRGYTDHEQLDDLGLVHMNGRVYDPVLGRFLSADPFIGDPSDSQDYNRYSYLGSNPLGGTDPSGYFSLKDGLKIVAAVVVGVITAGAALYGYAALMGGSFVGGFAGALSSVGLAAGWGGGWAIAAGAGFGFGSSFASSLLNGGSIGDAFKAGVIGGVVGGISAGIAGKIGDFAEGHEWFQGAGQNLAHGIAQGGLTEAQGGEFRHGFYAGFASSAAAGPIQATMPNSMGGRVAAAAVVGGTASALGGGKFANGAVSGAFTYMFNHEAHSWWDDTKETLSVAWQGAKQGYYAWADGLNPFGDFYADMGLYNASDPALQWSQRFGVVSQVAGGGLVGGAGLYGGARSVFWSGGRTAARAAETLGRPIQKTLWGRVMNAAQGGLRNVFGKPAADKAMAPFWDAASSVYAMNVRGTAQAYILRPGPVWTNVERPLLDMLGKSYRVVP
jgi:RHS repeat-associated protein